MEKETPELIREYIKPVYNLVFRLTGKSDEAEDLTQETFLKAWKNIKKFDKNKSFKTWIFTIAHNTVIDFYRKKKPIPFSKLDSANDEDGSTFESSLQGDELSPEELFEKQQEESILLSALENLSLDERTIIVLHHTDELTFDEISDVLKKPINTIKSTYRRSLIKLRKSIMHQN